STWAPSKSRSARVSNTASNKSLAGWAESWPIRCWTSSMISVGCIVLSLSKGFVVHTSGGLGLDLLWADPSASWQQMASHLCHISVRHYGRMSRIIYSRIAWTVIALAVVVTAIFAVQDVVAGPEDRDLGPVVENTHEPAPSPSPSES